MPIFYRRGHPKDGKTARTRQHLPGCWQTKGSHGKGCASAINNNLLLSLLLPAPATDLAFASTNERVPSIPFGRATVGRADGAADARREIDFLGVFSLSPSPSPYSVFVCFSNCSVLIKTINRDANSPNAILLTEWLFHSTRRWPLRTEVIKQRLIDRSPKIYSCIREW